MLMKMTFLILLSRFPNKISSNTCIPNSHIFLNDKLCLCDRNGRWTDSYCLPSILRRHLCRPGHVTVQGCTRCVCRADGQYACDDRGCAHSSTHDNLVKALPWCNPFRTYYIDCNICICPASGKTSDARCAFDISCSFTTDPTTTEIATRKTMCIPKVMYLFSCLHCLCSDDGYFTLKKCVVTCAQIKSDITSQRCIPKTLYRKGCNICMCPRNSIPDDAHCTNTTCDHLISFKFLRTLKDKHMKCVPHEFIKPRCVYCDCNQDGGVDESTCLDLECLRNKNLKYDIPRETCNPGEMVPFCIECLCTRDGVTSDEYCSKACSYQSKLKVLDRIISMPNSKSIINMETITKKSGNEVCAPNTIYIDKNRICICPDTGITNFNMCTTAVITGIDATSASSVKIDFNSTCEPSTFVEFDCNTCFCTKSGKIDPKWCTYDDCEAKRIIQKSNDVLPESNSEDEYSDTCSPGSITNVDCNFCICPDSGLTEDRVCTRNNCSGVAVKQTKEKFSCEPSAYYEVDCNICYCPKDGIKNISKCTKNHCDKSILRSDACAPGQLFSEECNVCVCPPDGNKEERACTNYSCADTAPWNKIHQLSETLLGHQIAENDVTRHLDLCFPGEEFVVGCKICVCPDVGLKMYATCTPSFCEEGSALKISKTKDINYKNDGQKSSGNVIYRKLETRRESCSTCMTFNYSAVYSRQKCTPGSMYIIKCKQCICPYAGSIGHYCRPLPDDFYCEQAYPKQNFLPMGRRRQKEKIGNASNAMMSGSSPTAGGTGGAGSEGVLHEHTRYRCHSRGNVTDDCFRCECDGSTIIEQHCFQNTAKYCEGLKPSFLRDNTDMNHSTIIDFT